MIDRPAASTTTSPSDEAPLGNAATASTPRPSSSPAAASPLPEKVTEEFIERLSSSLATPLTQDAFHAVGEFVELEDPVAAILQSEKAPQTQVQRLREVVVALLEFGMSLLGRELKGSEELAHHLKAEHIYAVRQLALLVDAAMKAGAVQSQHPPPLPHGPHQVGRSRPCY